MAHDANPETPGATIPTSARIANAFRAGDGSALDEHDVVEVGDLVERLVVLMPRADGRRLTSRLFDELDS